jgi:hypothetical protein
MFLRISKFNLNSRGKISNRIKIGISSLLCVIFAIEIVVVIDHYWRQWRTKQTSNELFVKIICSKKLIYLKVY